MRFCLWEYVTAAKMPLHWSVIHYQMTFGWHSGCGLGCGLETSIVSNLWGVMLCMCIGLPCLEKRVENRPCQNHRVPARFWVDSGHILVKKKYILGKNLYFLPNIYFFSTNMCPKSTKKCTGTL